jgi:hypothetical protein
MTTNAMTFGSDLLVSAKLSASFHAKKAWPGIYEPSGASITLQHPSSDPYGGYSRVWRQLMWFYDHKCHYFWLIDLLVSAKLSASFHTKRHGLALMGHQEPAPLCSIPHQTHMEDINRNPANVTYMSQSRQQASFTIS